MPFATVRKHSSPFNNFILCFHLISEIVSPRKFPDLLIATGMAIAMVSADFYTGGSKTRPDFSPSGEGLDVW